MQGPNVNIYKIQMAYFFKEGISIRTFGLINSLYVRLKDVFKTEPQSLGVPEEIPDEVPRCIWNDINTSLTFNKIRLDFSFNIPTKFNWEELTNEFNQKITEALNEQGIIIERVGLISELMSTDNLHTVLENSIQIVKFNDAKEANISWLENVESYNVWTYITIDEPNDINKIMFDINSLSEYKLENQGITSKDAMCKCKELLKRKMIDVF